MTGAEPSDADVLAAVVQELVVRMWPRLAGLKVRYVRDSQLHYEVHRGPAGIMLTTGLSLRHPQRDRILERAGRAALEVELGETRAVSVRQHG